MSRAPRLLVSYDELSDHGYNPLPKRYQNSDALQVQNFGWGLDGFSPKKWSKNSFFEYHDSGSSNFGLGWDSKF